MSLTTCRIHRCRMPIMDIVDGYDGWVVVRRPVCPKCRDEFDAWYFAFLLCMNALLFIGIPLGLWLFA